MNHEARLLLGFDLQVIRASDIIDVRPTASLNFIHKELLLRPRISKCQAMCVCEVQLQVMFLVERHLTHPANKLDDVFSVLHVLIELRFLRKALVAYRTRMHAVHVHAEML